MKCDNNNICDALSLLYGKIRIFRKLESICNCKINFRYTYIQSLHVYHIYLYPFGNGLIEKISIFCFNNQFMKYYINIYCIYVIYHGLVYIFRLFFRYGKRKMFIHIIWITSINKSNMCVICTAVRYRDLYKSKTCMILE